MFRECAYSVELRRKMIFPQSHTAVNEHISRHSRTSNALTSKCSLTIVSLFSTTSDTTVSLSYSLHAIYTVYVTRHLFTLAPPVCVLPSRGFGQAKSMNHIWRGRRTGLMIDDTQVSKDPDGLDNIDSFWDNARLGAYSSLGF